MQTTMPSTAIPGDSNVRFTDSLEKKLQVTLENTKILHERLMDIRRRVYGSAPESLPNRSGPREVNPSSIERINEGVSSIDDMLSTISEDISILSSVI